MRPRSRTLLVLVGLLSRAHASIICVLRHERSLSRTGERLREPSEHHEVRAPDVADAAHPQRGETVVVCQSGRTRSRVTRTGGHLGPRKPARDATPDQPAAKNSEKSVTDRCRRCEAAPLPVQARGRARKFCTECVPRGTGAAAARAWRAASPERVQAFNEARRRPLNGTG